MKEQLGCQQISISQDKVELFEKLRRSILTLYFKGYLTESKKESKFKKLFGEIEKSIKLRRVEKS